MYVYCHSIALLRAVELMQEYVDLKVPASICCSSIISLVKRQRIKFYVDFRHCMLVHA